MTCLNCGNEKSRPQNKYCCVACQQAFQWSELVKAIEKAGSILTLGNAGDGTRVGRRFMLEKCGHQCTTCKRKTWLGEPIPLVLDHIDGNSWNWKLCNLRLLCPNCDALTPTYKGRNRGNGRHARRLRYAQGKSF